MSLAAWQSSVVRLVSHGSLPTDAEVAEMSPRELAWFEVAQHHPGTEVTREVARSWRWRRVAVSAPLTVLSLRRCGLLGLARSTYLAETFSPATWASAEGREFLHHVGRRWGARSVGAEGGDLSHLATFVALDAAVLAARASTWTTNIRASRPDDAVSPGVGGLIRVGCDARDLLRNLLAGDPLPRAGSGHGAFLVAPGIDGCFREATPGEIRALTLVGDGCPVSEVAGLWPNDLIDIVTLTRLEAIGALVRQPPTSSDRHRPQVLLGSPA